uniref:Uncharacterized protein n=1 Tax=Pseudomonas fluorescens (strain SBW25) TaxID=216595 RepID=A0A0G4E4Z8_PSEFS|nr:hypothetical protein [Pseudomonas fluorescens]CEK42305.1 hypothetical protein PQBR57_0352 [Pseudomonas fluorescens SBW25]
MPEHNEATIPSRTPKSPKVDFSIFGDFKIQFAAVAVECAASRVVYKTAQLIRAMGTVEVGYVSNNDYGFAHDQASVDDANQIGDNTGKAATELSAVATQLDP